MILDTVNRKLQVVLSEAKTTNDCPVVASFFDSGAVPTGGPSLSNTNGVTAVDIVAAPGAGFIRQVNELTLFNADTVTHGVTVRFNDNGTTYNIIKVSLLTGETITYSKSLGWHTLDASGNLKTTFGGLATANLSDFQTGTWTPTLAGDSTAGAGTYSVQDGKYTKIGSLYVIQYELVWSAFSGAVGNVVINGLPAIISGTNSQPGFFSQYSGITMGGGYTQLSARLDNGASRLQLIENGSGVSAGFLPVSGIAASGNIIGGAVYR